MQRRTRNYARRQVTWMRKLPNAAVLDVTGREPADVADELIDRWRETAD
jgi:tRNA dimethylallyltransferase